MNDVAKMEFLRARGKVFAGIPSLLVTENYEPMFLDLMAKELNISRWAIKNWAKVERKMPEDTSYGFSKLWAAVTVAVEKFVADDSIPTADRRLVRCKWDERKALIEAMLNVTFFDISLTDELSDSNTLSKMKAAAGAENFPKLFAYKLSINFEGYCTITPIDLAFTSALIRGTDSEKRKIQELIGTVEKKPILESIAILMSTEGQQWLEIRNNTYSHNFKGNKNPADVSWKEFDRKALTLRIDKRLCLLAFVSLIWPDEAGISPLGQAEIDQLLVFKYCLTEGGQKVILNELATEYKKAAGDV